MHIYKYTLHICIHIYKGNDNIQNILLRVSCTSAIFRYKVFSFLKQN